MKWKADEARKIVGGRNRYGCPVVDLGIRQRANSDSLQGYQECIAAIEKQVRDMCHELQLKLKRLEESNTKAEWDASKRSL